MHVHSKIKPANAPLQIFSFWFLILRLLAVYYFSSRINAESRKPIRILFAVSSEVYNPEVYFGLVQSGATRMAIFIKADPTFNVLCKEKKYFYNNLAALTSKVI